MDVSFIVPALNEEKYIEKTLRSISRQKTDRDFEIIVVDGGSTDRTAEIARKYGKVLPQKGKGIAAARNQGADAAGGKLLVFVDADTYLPRSYLQKVWNHMKRTDVVALTARIKYGRKGGRLIRIAEKISDEFNRLCSDLGRARLTGVNIAVWKWAFEKAGKFPEVPSEDVAFSRAMTRMGKIEYYTGTHVISHPRRFDGPDRMLDTVVYYLLRDIITALETSNDRRIRELGKDLEEKVGKYRPIR